VGEIVAKNDDTGTPLPPVRMPVLCDLLEFEVQVYITSNYWTASEAIVLFNNFALCNTA